MGCIAVLVGVLGLIIGLVVLPTIVDITSLTSLPGNWTTMEAVVDLLPFAFLIIVFIGVIWIMGRGAR